MLAHLKHHISNGSQMGTEIIFYETPKSYSSTARGKVGQNHFSAILWFGLELAIIQFDNSSPSSLLSAWLGWMWVWVIVTVLVFKEFAFWFFEMLAKSSHISLDAPRNSLIPHLRGFFLECSAIKTHQNLSKLGSNATIFPSTRYDLLLYNTDQGMNYFSLTELCGLPGTQHRSVLLKIF